jgi:hypothetical protein
MADPAHLLHFGAAQIGRTRILAAADIRLAASVICMAKLALLAIDLVSTAASGLPGAVLSGFFIVL